MKKSVIFLISIIIILISGCSYSQEEQQQMKQYESQAKENAAQYILSKYGFEAKIKDTKIQKADSGPVPDFTPPPTGNVFVKMEYNNRDFYVYITGEKGITGRC